MMKSLSEFARAFPEFNSVGFVRREKCIEFAEYSSRVDLVRMGSTVKYFLGHMDRVSYNDDFGDITNGACLIDTASDSKKFSFYTCYKGSMMNCFD